MCGIFTAYHQEIRNEKETCEALERVAEALYTRGPDHRGYRVLAEGHVDMVHTRLAIQDLSNKSNQPISHSSTSENCLVYNGEIYNTSKLINKYSLNDDRSVSLNSDTSVLLSLLNRENPSEFLGSIDGMVAFCYYDGSTKTILFYRDHTGQKPLFFKKGRKSDNKCGDIEVASSIAAFKSYKRETKFKHDNEILDTYLLTTYLGPDETVYEDIENCVPGYLYRYNCNTGAIQVDKIHEKEEQYKQISGEDKEAAFADMKDILVGSRNLGVLLSGGIDSSIVAAQLAGLKQISCAYTLQNEGTKDSEELENAKLICRRNNIKHILVPYCKDQATNLAINIASIIDHPNPDSSILPTTLIGIRASKESTVLLTGDGADEYFGGYNRYTNMVNRYGRIYPKLPIQLKRKLLIYYLSTFAGTSKRFTAYRKISKNNLLEKYISYFTDSLLTDIARLDSQSYMHQSTLPKTDRALMHSSVEGRAPFLMKPFRMLGRHVTERHPYETGKQYLKRKLRKLEPEYMTVSLKKGFSADLAVLFKEELFEKTIKGSCQDAIDMFEGEGRKYALSIYRGIDLDEPNTSILRKAWHIHTIVKCYQRLNE